LKKDNKEVAAYIEALEDKIVDLSLRLKKEGNNQSSGIKDNKKLIGQLIHNLRNPVGVIQSFSEMMRDGGDHSDSQKTQRHVEIINKSASFSLALLDGFSSYFNLLTSDLGLNFSEVNITEIVKKVLEQLESMAIEKQINIITAFPGSDVMIDGDGSKMTQAISNIVVNAIRYSQIQSEVSVAIEENQKVVEIGISDRGIGIAGSDLPQIFKPFFVVNTYSADESKCIGLGLSIAELIVKGHGGQLKVSSTLGEGSIFRIIIPKTQ
jgi:signal transduction histidine kinase